MNKVKTDRNLTITDMDSIFQEQQKFYEKLYTKDEKVQFNMSIKNRPQLNLIQKLLLESELTVEELSNALREMPNGKSPGLPGLTADFYKIFWGYIKIHLHKAFLQCIRENKLYVIARMGVLALLPKKNRDRQLIRNWRPITLLNINYKILAKAYANRLKLIINDVIHPDQKGFVKGRQISENIRQMFDIMEFTWMQQIPGIIILVDFEKAFDRVDYRALKNTLKYFNFGPKFIKIVELLFYNFEMVTTNNGYLSPSWTPTRGLFQGNSISSFLFLFIAELLAIKLRANPKIEGIEAKGIKYLLSQFADDLDIIMKFKESAWQELMYEFDHYKKCTGMLISYEKTTIYRNGSLRDSQAKFTSSQKVNWVSQPLNILGIYISHDLDEYTKLNLEPLVKKTRNLTKIWKVRGLTLMGKIQIINSLVASL